MTLHFASQMEELVEECISFIAKNIACLTKTAVDLSALADPLLSRIAKVRLACASTANALHRAALTNLLHKVCHCLLVTLLKQLPYDISVKVSGRAANTEAVGSCCSGC